MGRRERTDSLDLATALLRFRNGVTATVTASRIGQTKIRRIELTQRHDFVVLDLIRQDLTIHRVDHNEFLAEGGARYRQSGLIEIPFLEHRGEPLALELEHLDRKSTRLNSSHANISYAVFCLKKNTQLHTIFHRNFTIALSIPFITT